jgi:hypothetical protein
MIIQRRVQKEEDEAAKVEKKLSKRFATRSDG